MLKRIKDNEEKLNKLIKVIKQLECALDNFEDIQEDIKAVNKYYGSKNWFRDKELFEKGEIKNIKAGVLSEDAVWNANENIKELIERMENIAKRV